MPLYREFDWLDAPGRLLDESTILRSRHRLEMYKLADVADVTEGNTLLHRNETLVFADAGYRGANKRLNARAGVRWQAAMRPGKRKNFDKANSPIGALAGKVEKLKARSRARVKHPFRMVKKQSGDVKVHYRGLKKNTLERKGAFCAVRSVDGLAPIEGGAGTTAFLQQAAFGQKRMLTLCQGCCSQSIISTSSSETSGLPTAERQS